MSRNTEWSSMIVVMVTGDNEGQSKNCDVCLHWSGPVSATLQSQWTSSMSLTNVPCIFLIHMIKEYLMIFYIFVEHINAYHEKTKTNNEFILHRAWYISLLCAIELCSCPQKIKWTWCDYWTLLHCQNNRKETVNFLSLKPICHKQWLCKEQSKQTTAWSFILSNKQN